jgi:hypothetical protein
VVPEKLKRRVLPEGDSDTFAINASIPLAASESPQDGVHLFGVTLFSTAIHSSN